MTAFMDELEADESDQELLKLEETLAKLRDEISNLKRDNKLKTSDNRKLREQLDMIQTIESEHTKPPAWAIAPTKQKDHHAIVSLMMSDLHLDEIVDPAEVEGLSAYSREIAEARMGRLVDNTIKLTRDYISGVKYDGMYLFLGGDCVSGFIHEELTETNECPVPETIQYWLDPIASAIGTFADEFGQVHVSGVVGNHGRMTRKPRAKRRVTDNIDWLIYRLLMRDFKGDSRITWQIPQSADTTVQIYDTKFLFTHGDQFRGGSGIAGIYSPLMLGEFKKSRRAAKTGRLYDHIVMGHFHQYSTFKNIIINGTLKGLDEYSYVSNFDYEPPQQALWMTTPENGITMHAPVLVEDRKSEGW